ncbi:hypothetical protein DFH27DRAFT_524770 [Peziza echinospora]|nr:hypothetical protein DFH27DRAFT_524770 [Peziza echinospora]
MGVEVTLEVDVVEVIEEEGIKDEEEEISSLMTKEKAGTKLSVMETRRKKETIKQLESKLSRMKERVNDADPKQAEAKGKKRTAEEENVDNEKDKEAGGERKKTRQVC